MLCCLKYLILYLYSGTIFIVLRPGCSVHLVQGVQREAGPAEGEASEAERERCSGGGPGQRRQQVGDEAAGRVRGERERGRSQAAQLNKKHY